MGRRKKKKAFVPEAYDMREMDVVLTASRFPITWESIKRNATAGWRNTFNNDVSTHAGFIVKVNGKWMIAELKYPSGKIVPFEKYITRRKLKPRIVAVKRFAEYNDEKLRRIANKRTCQDCVKFEYDIPGLFEFYNICKDKPHKYYCSEFVRYESAIDKVKWRQKFYDKIGPYSIELEGNSKMMWHE